MSDIRDLRLTVIGTNHRHAGIEARERLVCKQDILPDRLRSIVQGNANIKEVVLLSTCNRTEIYTASIEDPKLTQYLTNKLSDWSGIPSTELKQYLYTFTDEKAVYHLISVASGLDSMVLGEQQIQDQAREAAKAASQAGTIGRFLSELFHQTDRVSGLIREQSGLQRRSASSAAVSLLREVTNGRSIRSILVIGAGKMIVLAVDHLSAFPGIQILVANRTPQRARDLAGRVQGQFIPFTDIQAALHHVDAVLVCTSSTDYILKEQDVGAAVSNRSEKPLILIDASVPRNIEPTAGKLTNVRLYDIDDLLPFLEKDGPDGAEIENARRLVEAEVERLYARVRSYSINTTLKQMMTLAEEIRESELNRALRRLDHASDRDKKILDILTKRIVNKLLYEPTLRLRKHASNGDGQAYEAAIRDLFAIDQESRR